jgi:hypothetical protein
VTTNLVQWVYNKLDGCTRAVCFLCVTLLLSKIDSVSLWNFQSFQWMYLVGVHVQGIWRYGITPNGGWGDGGPPQKIFEKCKPKNEVLRHLKT